MANTRQVKNRIKTAKNISKITKAMEMVAASKMRKAQLQAVQSRPYATALEEILTKISQEQNILVHPLFDNHGIGSDLLICLSTDRGLSGSFNPTLFRKLLEWKVGHPKGTLLVVGRKAIAFTLFSGIQTFAQFSDLPDSIQLADILPITRIAMEGYLNHEFKNVSILYMDFVNTLSQKPKFQQLLPILPPDDSFTAQHQSHGEYIFEPSAKEILAELVPYYLENSVYQAFLESKASEHSARMVAMKNASESAGDLVDELQLIFNKSRQASITNDLLEITTATLSLHG